ncbi:MAG: hypothetical protein V4598_12545 [Bdellovibrionota bacterium]
MLLLFFVLVIFVAYISRPLKVHTISGRFEKLEFMGNKKPGRHYNLRLRNYPNTFVIYSKTQFEEIFLASTPVGSEITIKVDGNQITENDPQVEVFELWGLKGSFQFRKI